MRKTERATTSMYPIFMYEYADGYILRGILKDKTSFHVDRGMWYNRRTCMYILGHLSRPNHGRISVLRI